MKKNIKIPMKSNQLRFAIIILITFLIGYYIGVSKIAFDWSNFQPNLQISSKEPPPSAQFVDTNRMWVVLQKVEDMYYDKAAIDANKMLDGAIEVWLRVLVIHIRFI